MVFAITHYIEAKSVSAKSQVKPEAKPQAVSGVEFTIESLKMVSVIPYYFDNGELRIYCYSKKKIRNFIPQELKKRKINITKI